MRDELSHLDLNLLVTLQVLFEERSVTRAAQRLCITQPAMSRALQRLRDSFADPLFLRAGRGLVPTPRAELLAEKLGPILTDISRLTTAQPFRPELAKGEISIMSPDALSISFVPGLFAYVHKQAPGVKLISDSLSETHLELLASGERDFSVYINQKYADDFSTFQFLQCPQISWMRKGHPLAEKEFISVSDIRRYGVIRLRLPDRGHSHRENQFQRIIDTVERYQLADAVQMHITSLMTAFEIIGSSDALMLGVPLYNVSNRVQEDLIHRPLEPVYGDADLVLIQHKRTLASPLHSWIRERILVIGGAGG